MRQFLVLLSLILPAAASAGSANANIAVSANVANSCSISAGALAFGAYDPLSSTTVNGSATVSVACTAGSTSVITLGQGSNAAGGSTDAAPLRRMSNGAASYLSYSLYQDPTRLVPWTNASLGGVTYVSVSASPTNISVYGSIPGSQSVPAGTFTDTVVATVTF